MSTNSRGRIAVSVCLRLLCAVQHAFRVNSTLMPQHLPGAAAEGGQIHFIVQAGGTAGVLSILVLSIASTPLFDVKH